MNKRRRYKAKYRRLWAKKWQRSVVSLMRSIRQVQDGQIYTSDEGDKQHLLFRLETKLEQEKKISRESAPKMVRRSQRIAPASDYR